MLPDTFFFKGDLTDIELKEALKKADIRDKALILLMLTSGLKANQIMYLTIYDFSKAIDPSDLSELLDYQEKATEARWKIDGKEYVSSVECTKAILNYLIERYQVRGELSEKEPLFLSSNHINK